MKIFCVMMLICLGSVYSTNCAWGEPCFNNLLSYGCYEGLCWKQYRSKPNGHGNVWAYIMGSKNANKSDHEMGQSWCFIKETKDANIGFVTCINDRSCLWNLKFGGSECMDDCF